MRLYIVRHAEAEDCPPDGDDAARALTDAGRDSIPPVGGTFAALKIRPDLIWTSPAVRARQTAELLAKHLKGNQEIEDKDFLGLDSDFGELRRALRGIDGKSIVLVGHQPFLGECIHYWLAGNAHPGMHVPKASLICLHARSLNRGGMNLKFMLNRKIMAKLTD